jgi:hypothetical protein
MVFKNRVFNLNPNLKPNSNASTNASAHSNPATTVVVKVRAQGKQCGMECPPAPLEPAPTTPRRYWRVHTVPDGFSTEFPNDLWDVYSLDFFHSLDGSGPSLIDKSDKKQKAAASPSESKFSPDSVFGAISKCTIGNLSHLGPIWRPLKRDPAFIGWDFGPSSNRQNSTAAGKSAGSITIKQFDVQYCASELAVQWSDDSLCWYDAWHINASLNCPGNTTLNPTAGVTVSPPAVAKPKPAPPTPALTEADPELIFTRDAPLAYGGQVLARVALKNGTSVVTEGRSKAEAFAKGKKAAWCEYEAAAVISNFPEEGSVGDVHVTVEAASPAAYTLGYWRMAKAGTAE